MHCIQVEVSVLRLLDSLKMLLCDLRSHQKQSQW